LQEAGADLRVDSASPVDCPDISTGDRLDATGPSDNPTDDAADAVYMKACGACPCGACPRESVCLWGSATCESEMVTIPAGPFTMGCCGLFTEYECRQQTWSISSSVPAHVVEMPSFEADRTEVMNRDYRDCVDAGACDVPEGVPAWESTWGLSTADYDPVIFVSWFQAEAYCTWKGKRLCSEAEWERAARGTGCLAYPWGNDDVSCKYTVTWQDPWDDSYPCSEMTPPECGYGCGSGRITMPVGSRPLDRSPDGVVDVGGNAAEWVADWFHNSYDGAPTDGGAWVEPHGTARVTRGGYLFKRGAEPPKLGFFGSGIRCCRSIAPDDGP
jgi:formylglycine-generating enzyme required for sulfatase activity